VHDDIAFSILSKLPIKSLTRFTCAKKSWSLLFQNPTFMNTFRTNFFKPKHIEDDDEACLLVKEESRGFPSHESPCILSGEKFEKKVSLDWPPPFQQDDSHNIFPSFPLSILILGSASVNGTLCLYRGFAGAIKIVLWNPATAEFKVIPPSFQPHENTQFNYPPYGFGYDSVKDDFKIIRKVYYPLEFRSGDWVYLPDKDDPFWERDVHELDLNDSFWEEKKAHSQLV
jgi:molecular chaperone HtpG